MAERARPSAATGWLTTLFGAAILIVLGFGVGLVAGAVFEEPDLVIDHLGGRTALVDVPSGPGELPPEAPAATAGRFDSRMTVPPVAPAERPLGAARDAAVAAAPTPEPPPAVAAAEPARAPAPTPSAAPEELPAVSARAAGFAIQVGAFGERPAADALVSALQGARQPAYLVEGRPGERVRYRVRVGPFDSRDEAARVASRLEKEQGLPTWVLAEDGS